MSDDSSIDTRLSQYMQGLRAGNEDACTELRVAWEHDPEITTKFRTIERIWLKEMSIYVRELQILRRERDAYKSIAKGYEIKTNSPNHGNSHIDKGNKMLEQAEEARLEHEAPEILNVFKKV